MPDALISPYRRVEVRLLLWDDVKPVPAGPAGPVKCAFNEIQMVGGAFKSYHHNVATAHIPVDKKQRSTFVPTLSNKINGWVQEQHAKKARAPLVILYYQGFGTRDKEGNLQLWNGKDASKGGAVLYFSELNNAVLAAKCDVVVILNCSYAGSAVRARPPNRPNYDNHIKQCIAAVPANWKLDAGWSHGFAAALEQALREKRLQWPDNFKGKPENWTWLLNRNMGKDPQKNDNHALAFHLATPPANFATNYIVLGRINAPPSAPAGPSKK